MLVPRLLCCCLAVLLCILLIEVHSNSADHRSSASSIACPAHDSANDQNDLICLALGDVVNDQVGIAGNRSSLWSSFVN